jgi:HSP20 family protein
MSPTSRTMIRELDSLRDRLDRLFSDGEIGVISRPEGAITPALDVQETESEVIVKASMPGFKSEDIEVHLDNNTLTIRGTSHEEREEEEGTWHVRERRYGSMFRSFAIPTLVDNEMAEAKMSDGVLEIRLPKAESSRGRKIEVKSS